MHTDAAQIRTLVETWAHAVHRGDLATVLAACARTSFLHTCPVANETAATKPSAE